MLMWRTTASHVVLFSPLFLPVENNVGLLKWKPRLVKNLQKLIRFATRREVFFSIIHRNWESSHLARGLSIQISAPYNTLEFERKSIFLNILGPNENIVCRRNRRKGYCFPIRRIRIVNFLIADRYWKPPRY